MADVVFIVVTLAFFAASAAYVRGLDAMVRSSDEADSEPVMVDNLIGLAVAIALVAYLVVAMLFPERF